MSAQNKDAKGRHGMQGSNPIPESAEVTRVINVSEAKGTAMVQIRYNGHLETRHGSLKDKRIQEKLNTK